MDDATWQPHEMTSVASFWGHQGLFDALGAQAPDPNVVMRAPVQVMEGNYQRMSGVCHWWDSLQRN